MPEMTSQEYNLYAQRFKDQYTLLAQDNGGKLRKAVMEEHGLEGDGVVAANQIGETATVEKTDRYMDTPNISLTATKRWYKPQTNIWAHIFDKQDQIRLLGDPKSKIAENAMKAFKRTEDDVILDAYFGTNYTGKTGTTSTVFDSNNIVAVGSTGMTIDKLFSVLEILGEDNKVDLENEELFCIVSQKQANELLAEAKYASRDYGNTLVLEDGKLKKFLGFNFIIKAGLPLSSGDTLCPAFCKSGMQLGFWKDMVIDLGVRRDKCVSEQLYMEVSQGATRLEEAKCCAITCNI